MKLPPFNEQRNKIIQAYFKDEIQPLEPKFCFCGTLSPDEMWYDQDTEKEYPYSYSEYGRMEKALFNAFGEHADWEATGIVCYRGFAEDFPKIVDNYEDRLFNGMCAALDVLKQIHIEHGEVIDEVPVFTKRELVKA